jgi:pyruvate/2-oxoglutarate dehydrogenase complex dihydrolipoamide acyltransferase (E2) component
VTRRTQDPPHIHIPVRPPRELRASAAARKLAEELGVDLARVRPSGPDGQVTLADVREAAAAARRP